jgi:hypothetical protein
MDYAHETEKAGFHITLELLPEDSEPDWDFESEEERQELLRKIDQGVYLWFTAKVSAWKEGIELGTDYLGGCCYESVDDFIQPGDYYDDMVDVAIAEAKATIAKLCDSN